MADAEATRQTVQSRAPLSTWLGVVFLFALFGAIVLAIIGASSRGTNYEQLRAQKRLESLKKLRAEDSKQLSSYGWVDKNKGIVHLPIERAMELTVTELSAKKPAPAYPIATPPPAALPPAKTTSSPAQSPSAQPRGSAQSPPAAASSSPSPTTNPAPSAGQSPVAGKSPPP